jgi:hypothetical protein
MMHDQFIVTRDWLQALMRQAETGAAITLPAEQMRALLAAAERGVNAPERAATILRFPLGGIVPK